MCLVSRPDTWSPLWVSKRASVAAAAAAGAVDVAGTGGGVAVIDAVAVVRAFWPYRLHDTHDQRPYDDPIAAAWRSTFGPNGLCAHDTN